MVMITLTLLLVFPFCCVKAQNSDLRAVSSDAVAINILSNGDFESGTLNGWNGNVGACTIIDEVGNVHRGKYAVKVPAKASMGIIYKAEPKTRYHISWWVKVENYDLSKNKCPYSIVKHVKFEKPLGFPMSNLLGKSGYINITRDYETGDSTANFDDELHFWNPSAGSQVFYIDDVEITKLGAVVAKVLDHEPENVELDPSVTLKPIGPTDLFKWSYATNYSDEFDETKVDSNKWDIEMRDWSTASSWNFFKQNANIEDGNLCLSMTYDGPYIAPYNNKEVKTLYLKSGAARTWKVITYGYFECRMKSTELIPGTCPAFWMYSTGGYQGEVPCNRGDKQVMYSEIDGIEVGQVYCNKKQVNRIYEMNLHTYCNNGDGWKWIRGIMGGDVTHGRWTNPDLNFDIRKDYHTYGIWNRSDSIIMYIDGVKRNSKKNVYWHLPMRIIVSLGVRPPYVTNTSGFGVQDPTKVAAYKAAGQDNSTFPQVMKVDYLRSWKILPQIVSSDPNTHLSHISPVQGSITFKGKFNAGSGSLVKSEKGISMFLVEKDIAGKIIKTVKTVNDVSAKDKELGNINLTMSLSGIPVLTNGHYYDLELSMKPESISMTKEGTVKTRTSIVTLSSKGMQQTAITNVEENKAANTLQISLDQDSKILNVKNVSKGSFVYVYNVKERLILRKKYNSKGLNLSSLETGVYFVRINKKSQKIIIK